MTQVRYIFMILLPPLHVHASPLIPVQLTAQWQTVPQRITNFPTFHSHYRMLEMLADLGSHLAADGTLDLGI